MNAKTQGKEWSVWVSGAMARNFCKIVDAEQNIIAVVQNDPSGIVTHEDEANAELICRSVNNHHELVELVKLLDEHEGAEGWSKGMRERIDAVLAKAEASQREGK